MVYIYTYDILYRDISGMLEYTYCDKMPETGGIQAVLWSMMGFISKIISIWVCEKMSCATNVSSILWYPYMEIS